jgi:hypothetical protein
MPYYDEAGNELDPSKMPVPKMCQLCEKKDDPEEDIICNLHRLEKRNDRQFSCSAYVSLYGPLIDDIIV